MGVGGFGSYSYPTNHKLNFTSASSLDEEVYAPSPGILILPQPSTAPAV